MFRRINRSISFRKFATIFMIFTFVIEPLSLCLPTKAEAAGNYGVHVGSSESGYDAGGSGSAGLEATAVGHNAYATKEGTVAIGRYANATTNTYATAVGPGAFASGQSSAAFGSAACATGQSAVAIGVYSNAIGAYSISIGGQSKANADQSIAMGANSYAGGYGSIAIGDGTKAYGKGSVALGYSTAGADTITATTDTYAFAAGKSTASGKYSTATGNATASGAYSVAMGYQSKAYGWGSIALGNSSAGASTVAATTTTYDIAIGYNASSTGPLSSIAIGRDVQSTGYNTVAMGYDSKAYGMGSVAIGTHSVAGKSTCSSSADIYAVAMGYGTNAIGAYSVAMGKNSNASGNYAFAMGNETKAYGAGSTAFGHGVAGNETAVGADTSTYAFAAGWSNAYGLYSTALGKGNAYGEASTAIGNSAKAFGNYSVALGNNANAYGAGSVALGNGVAGNSTTATATTETYAFAAGTSKAYNKSSTALGAGSIATGEASIAAGAASKANAYGAVALGNVAEATGFYSVAMGTHSTARGEASFAMGIYANTSDCSSVSMGYYTNASGCSSVAMGYLTNSTGKSSFAMGYMVHATNKYAIAMGHQNNASGDSSISMGTGTQAIANNSVAIGNGTIASAKNAVALGLHTNASGYGSFAVGNDTNAAGYYSVAMGYESKAYGMGSVALGKGTAGNSAASANADSYAFAAGTSNAYGNYSTAFGSGSTASGNYSTALGAGSTASGEYSTAIGRWVYATGNTATAFGGWTHATGSYSTAMGQEACASGSNSFAAGFHANASGDASVALGYYTNAEGHYTFAVGEKATAYGKGSVALGAGTAGEEGRVKYTETYAFASGTSTATEAYSTAMGKESCATNNYAFATGQGSCATGHGSFAGGVKLNQKSTVAYGTGSFAYGVGVQSGGFATWDAENEKWIYTKSGDYTVAMGQDTTASANGAVAMGQRSSASGTNSFAIGYETCTGGYGAVAMGERSRATANHTFAMGYMANATAQSAIAMGNQACATGSYSIAMGTQAQALADNSYAFGGTVDTAHTGSVALGSGSETNGSNQISVGSSSSKRRIINVADGTADTDAATFGQTVNAASYDTSTGKLSLKHGTTELASTTIKANLDYAAASTDGGGGTSPTIGTGATAVGYSSCAGGYATAVGYNANASAWSVAVGYGSSANGSSAAFGRYSAATGDSSVAVGYGSQATQNYAVALGHTSCASGEYSVALGYNSCAGDSRSVALGYYSCAAGDSSVALGYYSCAAASNSVALGNMAKVSSSSSGVAIGYNSSIGNNMGSGIALGENSAVVGASGVAIGSGARAGYMGVALGYNSRTSGMDEVSVGYYNSSTDKRYRRITNVADGTADSDAATVGQLKNASIDYASATNPGTSACASGSYATALGYASCAADSATAIGYGSCAGYHAAALGHGASATANYTAALGYNAQATADYTAALGYNAQATADQATAIGNEAKAKHNNSVAIGYNSCTTSANEVSVGNASDNIKRKITNVTAGTADTDAATYGQAVNAASYDTASGTLSLKHGDKTLASTTIQTKIDYASATGSGTSACASGEQATALGYSSCAGNFATAVGYASCAGYHAAALGYSSCAGDYATALGYSSCAGNRATAVGHGSCAASYATSLGYGSQAVESYATALGYSACAAGYYATALGNLARATANYATALGYYTCAGEYATAIGHSACATGSNAIAIGNSEAIGEYSFAAVSGTAKGANSVAIGEDAYATMAGAVAIGTSRAGFENIVYVGGEPYDTVKTGTGSTAIGYYTVAAGDYSFAGGTSNVSTMNMTAAAGKGSFAYGTGAQTGSVALPQGMSNDDMVASYTGGDYAVSMGENTKAVGSHSVALGNAQTGASYAVYHPWNEEIYVQVGGEADPETGEITPIEKEVTVTTETLPEAKAVGGEYAMATGTSKAYGNSSTAQGASQTGYAYNTQESYTKTRYKTRGEVYGEEDPNPEWAATDDGTVTGNVLTVNEQVNYNVTHVVGGEYATAMGQSQAIGNYSTAFGNSTAGEVSYDESGNPIITGNHSFAAGQSSAEGNYSTALGNSEALGAYSFAAGQSGAAGNRSIAIGGRNNDIIRETYAITDESIALGNSAIAGFRKTYATGDPDNPIGVEITGNNSIAIGTSVIAAGNGSFAGGMSDFGSGKLTGAAGTGSFAFGTGAQTGAVYVDMITRMASYTGGDYAVSIGYDTKAIGNYSVALGKSQTGASYTTFQTVQTPYGETVDVPTTHALGGEYALAAGTSGAYGNGSVALGGSRTGAVSTTYTQTTRQETVGWAHKIDWSPIDESGEISRNNVPVTLKDAAQTTTVIGGEYATATGESSAYGNHSTAQGSSQTGYAYNVTKTYQTEEVYHISDPYEGIYDENGKIITETTDHQYDELTVAGGEYATAMGQSQAIGNYSTAFGNSAAGAVIYDDQGQVSGIKGDYSFAAGSSSASGDYSAAFGEGRAKGDYSFAAGTAGAKGNYSVALGKEASATMTGSVAFGNSMAGFANIQYEGGQPVGLTQTGNYSTATGNYAVAAGDYSFAGGQSDVENMNLTAAAGNSSFAYGSGAQTGAVVLPQMSNGDEIYASYTGGDYAVSMGENTKAVGSHSVALGSAQTGASYATYVTTERERTVQARSGESIIKVTANVTDEVFPKANAVGGEYAMATGTSKAYGNSSTAQGASQTGYAYNTQESYTVKTIDWEDEENKIAKIDPNDPTKAKIIETPVNYDVTHVVGGEYATAMGASGAYGNYSTAVGNGAQAGVVVYDDQGQVTGVTGEGAFAGGTKGSNDKRTVAYGDGSFAYGGGVQSGGTATWDDNNQKWIYEATDANYTVAMGHDTTASGYASVAMGAGAVASNYQSISMGYNTNASGEAAVAMGANSTASADVSVAIGYGANASALGATALGAGTQASGMASMATGGFTVATGDGSFAGGASVYTGTPGQEGFKVTKYTAATGNTAFAFGHGANASGDAAVAMGDQTVAAGAVSVALGSNSSANGDASFAMGSDVQTTETAEGSAAVGIQTTVAGAASFAAGYGVGVSGNGAAGFGIANTVSGNGAFAAGGVGSGTELTPNPNTASGRNAVALGEGSGAHGNNSFAMGKDATASKDYSFAFGKNASAAEDSAIAFGADATASGGNSVAIGKGATASGANSFAFGGTASDVNSVALGNSAQAKHANSVAIGSDSCTSGTYEVSVGSSSQTRKITNVTSAGALSNTNSNASTGADIYNEVRPTTNGTYVKTASTTAANLAALDTKIGKIETDGTYAKQANSVSANLIALDTQVKGNADSIDGIMGSKPMTSGIDSEKVTKYETYVTGTGLNGGGRVITNIAAGVEKTDAARFGQVIQTATYSKDDNMLRLKNAAGDEIASVEIQAGSKNAVVYDDDSKASVKLGGASATSPVKLTNVAAATLNSTSTDAVTGAQLYATNQEVAGKQSALNTDQLSAVNSGITGTLVSKYNTHVENSNIHVSEADRANWNSALNDVTFNNTTGVLSKTNATGTTTIGTLSDFGLKEVKVRQVGEGADVQTWLDFESVNKYDTGTTTTASVNMTAYLNKTTIKGLTGDIVEGKNVIFKTGKTETGEDYSAVTVRDDINLNSVQVRDQDTTTPGHIKDDKNIAEMGYMAASGTDPAYAYVSVTNGSETAYMTANRLSVGNLQFINTENAAADYYINANSKQIANVAAGTHSTDAVNYGQLSQALGSISYNNTTGELTQTTIGGTAKNITLSDYAVSSVTAEKVGEGSAARTYLNFEVKDKNHVGTGYTTSVDMTDYLNQTIIGTQGNVSFLEGSNIKLLTETEGTHTNVSVSVADNITGITSVTAKGKGDNASKQAKLGYDNDGYAYASVTNGTKTSTLKADSLTVGNNTYITADGINANGKPITNVASAGTLASTNYNAVNAADVVAETRVSDNGSYIAAGASAAANLMKLDTAIGKVGDTGQYIASGNSVAQNLTALDTAIGNKANKGQTLAEYGIGDAYDKATINTMLLNIHSNYVTTEFDVTVGRNLGVAANATFEGNALFKKGADMNSYKITNVEAGDLSDNSTDVVVGSQLNATNQNVAANKTAIDKINTSEVMGSGINSSKVAKYEGYEAEINSKQAQLTEAQLNAVNSGVTKAKVEGYDAHLDNGDIHVTADQKTVWSNKQDALTDTQKAAVNSTITSEKVATYEKHVKASGLDADNAGISNVAAQDITSGGKYAATTGQLYNVSQQQIASFATGTSGNVSAVKNDGTAVKVAQLQDYTLEKGEYDTANKKLVLTMKDSYGVAGNSTVEVSLANLSTNSKYGADKGEVATVDGDHTLTIKGGKNISTAIAQGADKNASVTVIMNDDIDVTSVTAGNVTVSDNSVKVGSGTDASSLTATELKVGGTSYITGSGLNASGNAVSNVGEQTVESGGTYAATTGQLYSATTMSEDGKYYASGDSVTTALGKVDTALDTHATNSTVHITADERTAWNSKQSALNETQMAAVNSGVTAAKVTKYETYVTDSGLNADNKAISNVAAQTVEKDGAFAATTGQLYNVSQEQIASFATGASGNVSAVKNDGTEVKVAQLQDYKVTGGSYNKSANRIELTVEDKYGATATTANVSLEGLTTASKYKAEDGTEKVVDGDHTLTFAGGVTANTSAKNINTKLVSGEDGNASVEIALADDLNVTSVTAGGVTLANNAVTVGTTATLTPTALTIGSGNTASSLTTDTLKVGGAAYITNSGISANNRVISNVADATEKSHATNLGQLQSYSAVKVSDSSGTIKENLTTENGIELVAGSNITLSVEEGSNKLKITSVGGTDTTAVHYDMSGTQKTGYVTFEGATEGERAKLKNADLVADEKNELTFYDKNGLVEGETKVVGNDTVSGSKVTLKNVVIESTTASTTGGGSQSEVKSDEVSVASKTIESGGDTVVSKSTMTGDSISVATKTTTTEGEKTETVTITDGDISLSKAEGVKYVTKNDTLSQNLIRLDQQVTMIDANKTNIEYDKESAVASKEEATTVGYSSNVSGKASTAVGYGNTVTGEMATVVGYKNVVSGSKSGAFGDPNTVSGSESYAFGNDNTVSTDKTFVLGNNVTETVANSVVLGDGSASRAATESAGVVIGSNIYEFAGKATKDTGVVSVGKEGAERQIQNVAAGEVSATSTDAVNGSQLYAAYAAIGESVSADVSALKQEIGAVSDETKEVGAMSAALAGLHYMEPSGEESDKFTGAVAYGGYRGKSAAAVGVAYKPSPDVMVSASTSVGNSYNSYNAGVSFKLGPGKTITRAGLAKQIKHVNEENQKLKKSNETLHSTVMEQGAKIKELEAVNSENVKLKGTVEQQGQMIQELMKAVNELKKKVK